DPRRERRARLTRSLGARDQPRCCDGLPFGRRLVVRLALRIENATLAFDPPVIATETAIALDDAMTGHDQGRRVGAASARDCARRLGTPDTACHFGVAAGSAGRNLAQGTPHLLLKCGPANIERQAEVGFAPCSECDHSAHPVCMLAIVALDGGA